MNFKMLFLVAVVWAVSITTYVVVRPTSPDPQQASTSLLLQQNNEALQKQLTELTAELKKQTDLLASEEQARKKEEEWQNEHGPKAYRGRTQGYKKY